MRERSESFSSSSGFMSFSLESPVDRLALALAVEYSNPAPVWPFKDTVLAMPSAVSQPADPGLATAMSWPPPITSFLNPSHAKDSVGALTGSQGQEACGPCECSV